MWKEYYREMAMAAVTSGETKEKILSELDHNLNNKNYNLNANHQDVNYRHISNEEEINDASTLEQHISEIIVLPSPDLLGEVVTRDGAITSASKAGGSLDFDTPEGRRAHIATCICDFSEFVRAKIGECQQIIRDTSVISFTANLIESRIISNELGSKLAKLYELLDVHRMEEFESILHDIIEKDDMNSEDKKYAEIISNLRQILDEWDRFLTDIDRKLDQLVGPEKTPDLDSTDDIHLVSHNKMFRSGTLLSYLKKSAYEMIFLEIVTSFLTPNCYQHVKVMFENLTEFQKNNCDILLLTKRPNQGGSGFLKLIGIPFRILLNEKDSLKQLLAHRRSVVSLAGVRAIHGYAEFASNEHAFEVDPTRCSVVSGHLERAMSVESESGINEARSLLGNESGCALVNRRGHILYSYVCQNNNDWPDVELLLQRVKEQPQRNAQQISTTSTVVATTGTLPGASDNADKAVNNGNDTTSVLNVQPPGGKIVEKSDVQTVTVYSRKCCTIL